MSLKKKDQDAIASLYMESWNDNPYIDDVKDLKKHQAKVDRESGRIQSIPNSKKNVFEDDPNNMQSDQLDSRFENAKNSKIAAIFDTSKRAKEGDYNARVILNLLKLSFKSWAKDLNLLDDPEVKAALGDKEDYNWSDDPDSEYGGF